MRLLKHSDTYMRGCSSNVTIWKKALDTAQTSINRQMMKWLKLSRQQHMLIWKDLQDTWYERRQKDKTGASADEPWLAVAPPLLPPSVPAQCQELRDLGYVTQSLCASVSPLVNGDQTQCPHYRIKWVNAQGTFRRVHGTWQALSKYWSFKSYYYEPWPGSSVS